MRIAAQARADLNRIWRFLMRRRILAAVIAAVAVGAPTVATAQPLAATRVVHRHFFKHHHECWTQRCADHGTALYNANKRKERERREAREARERPPMSALEVCIIQRESGGDPNAVNGIYSGIAQWEPAAWQEDGGTRYAATPLGASYAQQEIVLREALAAGKSGQWTPYDGC